VKTRVVREWPGAEQMVSACHDAAIAVADGVWLSPGLSNSYLVQTDEGRVVINTGMGHEAPVHKRVYDAIDTSPIRFIVLTQGHVDHVGGVDHLRDESTHVIAQANNQRCQADDRRIKRFRIQHSLPFFRDAMKSSPAARSGPRPVQSEPVPDITFEDSYAFELGGRRFELYATPGGETIDQLTVWLPQQRIAFTGNAFGALLGHFPNLVTLRCDRYRDPLAIVASANRILALEPEVLCVGHFGPLVGAVEIRTEITRVRDAVQYVHDETVKGMNSGIDQNTLMRQIQLPEHLEVGQGYGRLTWSIKAIWEQYAGWFRGESTTELYPVPAKEVWPEVVAVAGADQLLARAESRLAAGETVHALHLVEMVLAAEPSHAHAWHLSRAAHERLLIDSSNFWETRWLRSQIEDAERAMETSRGSDQ
jgi:alkyl sulfatase BDS1-like metallo-beta-lactamase superfamily hydrolase